MKQIFRVSVILLLALAMALTTVSCAPDEPTPDTTTVGEQGDVTTTEPTDDGTTTTEPNEDGADTGDPTLDGMTELQLVKLVVIARAANVYAARGDEAAKTTFAEGSILTAEAEDAEWYLVKNEHGEGGFVAKTDVADATLLDSFEAVAEETWEVKEGATAVLYSYPFENATGLNITLIMRGTLNAGAEVVRLAANEMWSRVRTEDGEFYIMNSVIAKVGGTTPNPDGGDTNPPDDGNTTTAPNPDGGDTNPPDDGGSTPAGPQLVTDIRMSAAFETLNGVDIWKDLVHANVYANQSYRRGATGKSSIVTVNDYRLDANCILTLKGWALLDGGQDGLYWSVDGTTWTAFTGGQYTPADDALESATNSSGTYLGALTDAKAENGRFAGVTADLSAYNGQMINLSVAVRSAVDGNKYVEILKLDNLCVNCDPPADEGVEGPTQETVKNQNSRQDFRTIANFEVINGVSFPAGATSMTIHKPNTPTWIHQIAEHPGLTLGEDGKLTLKGWALINGGQEGLYWSTDKTTWHSFVGGRYFKADQAVLDAATSNEGAKLTTAKAEMGRFEDITADLSGYAGRTITVYVSVYGGGALIDVLTLTNVQVPAANTAD